MHENENYFVRVEAGFMGRPGQRRVSGCSRVDSRLPEHSLLLWKTASSFNAERLCAAVTVYYNSTIVMAGR